MRSAGQFHTVGREGYHGIATGDGGVVYVHRLIAYAHGKIDGLDDDRDVHHEAPDLDHCKIANDPRRLYAVDHVEHGIANFANTDLDVLDVLDDPAQSA